MSLIAIRNFIVPLQSKPQLGAIILAAVVVAIVRLSGFGVSGSNHSSREDEGSFRSNSEVEPIHAPEDSILNDLLKEEKRPKRARPAPSQSDGLSDIKRSLGLE